MKIYDTRNIILRKMKVRTGPCSCMEEANSALELISKVFGPNYYEANKKFSHAFKLNKILTPENIIVVKSDEYILGALPILERKINLFDQKIKALGIAGVAVHPEFQGTGLGKMLTNKAIEEFKKRNGIISVLFARRAVDGFYEKFGYVGTGYFTEMIIGKDSYENSLNIRYLGIKAREIKGKWHGYMGMYNKTYGEIPFTFHREEDWWKNICAWLQYKISPKEFFNVKYKDNLIGYFICKDNRIIEAACKITMIELFCNALLHFAWKNNFPELILAFPKEHRCIEYFQKKNHILKFRRAWNGGHMIRIINKDKFYELIVNYIRTRYSGIFNRKVVNESIDYVKEILGKLNENNHYEVNKTLFEIINNKSNPILKEIGNMFEHSWSIIDEF